MFFGLMIAFVGLVIWGVFLSRITYLSDDFHVTRVWLVRNWFSLWLTGVGVFTWAIFVNPTPETWQHVLQVVLMIVLVVCLLITILAGILFGLNWLAEKGERLLEKRGIARAAAGKQPWLVPYMAKHFSEKEA